MPLDCLTFPSLLFPPHLLRAGQSCLSPGAALRRVPLPAIRAAVGHVARHRLATLGRHTRGDFHPHWPQ